jgi:hypothetical protein
MLEYNAEERIMMHRAGLLSVLLSIGILGPDHAQGSEVRPFVDFEAGPAFPGYNDVRIPGDGGTTFSLTQQLKAPVTPYFRARAGVRIGRHEIFAFFAPLTIRPTGTVPYDVLFVDAVFPANTFLAATWTFDTYRLTYRYSIVDDETWQVAVGATALVRVASISLSGGGLYQVKNNVGVVPLLSFKVAWTFAGPWAILLDGDALAVPQGRAEDVFLGLRYRFGDAVSGRVGYRILEGGGDNSSVYNFALVNFLAFGFDVTL